MLNKQKALYLAVGGVLAMSASGAFAASANADGLGSVLHYPYYTVNNGADTYMSVVNSTASAKVVKVRFRDAKNTRDVLDFNLFLSAFDVWTAAITKNNASGGATLKTADTSCTAPAIPSGGVDFRTAAFNEIDDAGDIIDNSIGRTLEGHMEIIEMATVIGTTRTNITHVAGTPKDCGAALSTLYPGGAVTNTDLAAIGGGLFGTATVINVAQGVDYSYDATATSNLLCDPATGSAAGFFFHTTPTDDQPNLVGNGAQYCRTAFFAGDGKAWFATFAGANATINAASAPYMHSAVMAEWITDAAIGAGTDIVVSFPTKNGFVNNGAPLTSCGVPNTPPFTSTGFCTKGAAQAIGISVYNREEATTQTLLDFSPTTTSAGPALPWEVNVVTIANSDVLKTNNKINFNPPTSFSAGWVKFDFVRAGRVMTAATITEFGSSVAPTNCALTTIQGLPVDGFYVQKYVNGNVGGVLSNYGGNFNLKSERRVCQ
jgi:hypothetical protein